MGFNYSVRKGRTGGLGNNRCGRWELGGGYH